MKASSSLTSALLVLSIPTVALAHVRGNEPAPKETAAVQTMQDAKSALDELEASFAKLRPATNAQVVAQKTPAPSVAKAPAPQPLYGVFAGPSIKYPPKVSTQGRETIGNYANHADLSGPVKVTVKGDTVLVEQKSSFTGGPQPGKLEWRPVADGTFHPTTGNVSKLRPVDR